MWYRLREVFARFTVFVARLLLGRERMREHVTAYLVIAGKEAAHVADVFGTIDVPPPFAPVVEVRGVWVSMCVDGRKRTRAEVVDFVLDDIATTLGAAMREPAMLAEAKRAARWRVLAC